MYQSLQKAYKPNVVATQWPSLLSGVLDSAAATARGSARRSGGELLYSSTYSIISDTLHLKYLHKRSSVLRLTFKFLPLRIVDSVDLPIPVFCEISSAVVLCSQIKSSSLKIIIIKL